MNTGSYIDGKWFHPNSNRLVRNINPADPDEVIAEFPAATADDVRAPSMRAQAAFRGWRKTPGPERGRVLWRAADIARQRADEIARTLTREEGKILKEAKGEVMKGISLLEFYAGEGFRMHGKTLPSEARDTFTYTIRRPLGVVGLIAPWNFPWAIPVWKSAPALAAGNCVIFKPAELTPATATLLTEIYAEAGLPAGVFNMLVGSGSVVGEAMVHSPVLRAISFTGSNEVGGALYAKAAQRGAKVTCEMGGKNAVIVMADADLDKAADRHPRRRVRLHRPTLHRDLARDRAIRTSKMRCVERLVEARKKSKSVPDWTKRSTWDRRWTTNNGRPISITSTSASKKARGWCSAAKQPEQLGKGYFVEPTIFDNVAPSMRIFKEEIFGPVLSVTTAKNLDEALALSPTASNTA